MVLNLIWNKTMSSRFTSTEKWKDPWFRALPKDAKILYWYMWDTCDAAGFWVTDWDVAAIETSLDRKGIETLMEPLVKGYVRVNDNLVWLRRFLYHQNNLPLNPNCNAHKGIIKLINKRPISEKIFLELTKQTLPEGLPNPPSNSKGNGNSNGESEGGKTPDETIVQDIHKQLPYAIPISFVRWAVFYADSNGNETKGNRPIQKLPSYIVQLWQKASFEEKEKYVQQDAREVKKPTGPTPLEIERARIAKEKQHATA